jgi:hypothetical protein
VATATRESVEWIGRAGLATRGVLYGLVGLLAVRVALGDWGERADKEGALYVVARQSLGRVLLIAVLLGMLAYAGWRLVLAWRGDETTSRLADAGRAMIYLLGAYSAIGVLKGTASGNKEQDWTAKAFELPAGAWLVGAVGLAIVAAGLWNGYRAVSGHWRKKIETGEMEGLTDRWATTVAVGGLLGRMAVFTLAGGFLVRAGVRHDPAKGVGLDAALKEVASKQYGPWVLLLFAVGLLSFALFSFVEARYRRIEAT